MQCVTYLENLILLLMIWTLNSLEKMPKWIYFPADSETQKKRPSCQLSCNEVKNWKYIHILSYFSRAWPLFAKKLLNSNNNIFKIFFSKLLCSAYSGQICMELFFWFLLFEEFMYKKIQFKVVVLTYICVILLLENRPWKIYDEN